MRHTDSTTWTSPYSAVYEDHAIRLLQFSTGSATPILIVPPQAGHHSYIADYAPGQSLVACAVANTDSSVYAIEWKACTFERRRETINDMLDQLSLAIALVGPCHLVGLCQGGWLSTIHACLAPDSVASLTLAGAPIDTHAGDSSLHKATKLPLSLYRMTVAMGGGMMSGRTMLAAWKSSDAYKHYVGRHHAHNQSEKQDRFYAWYDRTQNLAGHAYLWIIDSLFQRNLLGRNELMIEGQHVNLDTLAQLKQVHILTGTGDDITPTEQSTALLRHTTAQLHSVDAGHIGVFMGTTGIRETWTPLFTNLEAAA